MLSLLIWSLGLPLGCSSAETASVQAAFVVARDAALAPPPPPREGWKADMLLQLSAPLFERLVLVALQSRGTITRELDLGGGLVLSPSLDVTKARVQASPKCESCMVANLRLEGPLKFQAAALGRGTWPVVVAAKVIVITEPVHKAGVWSLSARTQSVVDVTVRVKGLLPEMGNRRLREWVERELVEMGPKVMGAIPDEYPVAALRLVPAGNALEVQNPQHGGAADAPGRGRPTAHRRLAAGYLERVCGGVGPHAAVSRRSPHAAESSGGAGVARDGRRRAHVYGAGVARVSGLVAGPPGEGAAHRRGG